MDSRKVSTKECNTIISNAHIASCLIKIHSFNMVISQLTSDSDYDERKHPNFLSVCQTMDLPHGTSMVKLWEGCKNKKIKI